MANTLGVKKVSLETLFKECQVVSNHLANNEQTQGMLDVTFPEPPERDSLLYSLENCILTPHIAGSMENELQRMGMYMETEYKNFIQNKPCKYEVTLEMLKTMA